MTAGDKVSITCSGFGVPVPALAFAVPKRVTHNNITKIQQKGILQIAFIAKESLSGRYECTGANKYGAKKAWINVVGKYRDYMAVWNQKGLDCGSNQNATVP